MHFQIVPTTLCNARCFYCYESSASIESMEPETVKATICFIKSYIRNNSKEKYVIDWFGGEPMLVSELIQNMSSEILGFCKERSIDIKAEIVTNASLINREAISFLKKAGISRVHITLDGMGGEHEKRKAFIGGQARFNQIISCIQWLTDCGVQVMIRINVDNDNIQSCMDLIDYLGKTIPRTVEVHVAPLYGLGSSYLPPDKVRNVLFELQSQIDEYGFRRTVRKSINTNDCRDSQQRNLLIKPNGDIIHCEHMYNDSVAIIGNVFDGILFTHDWLCDKCSYFGICKQGCQNKADIDCDICWKSIWRE